MPDTEQAKRWLELSAQELPDAQYALGKLYLSDDPDMHDPAKGIYWLQQATDSGHEYAAYRLGKEYLTRDNIPKDTARAAVYIRQASEQANPYAQYLLGKLYLMGEGVPKDKDFAQYWFPWRSGTATPTPDISSTAWSGRRTCRRPTFCCLPHVCSTTWAASSEITRRALQRPRVSRSTTSACNACGKRRWPWGTNGTTMRMNITAVWAV